MDNEQYDEICSQYDSVNSDFRDGSSKDKWLLCLNCGYTQRTGHTDESVLIKRLLELIEKLKLEVYELKSLDNPDMDATDFAHPAWWRGCDHGVEKAINAVHGWLEDDYTIGSGSYQYSPMQNACNQIVALKSERDSLIKTADILLDNKQKWIDHGAALMKNRILESLEAVKKPDEFEDLRKFLDEVTVQDTLT
jgi:hypothetical protein